MWYFITVLLAWLPLIISIAGALALLGHSYLKQLSTHAALVWIGVGLLVSRVAYALLLTVGQWMVWVQDPLGRILLAQPLNSAVPLPFDWMRIFFAGKLGYFLFYVGGRFWLPVFVLIIIACLLYSIAALVHRLRSGTKAENMPLALYVSTLTVGWPGIVFFVPTWIVLALVSALYTFITKKSVPLTAVLAVSALATILVGPHLFANLYVHVLAF